ncbi:MAG: alpha/beta hydrolase family protein [Pseudomonadota bacterium]
MSHYILIHGAYQGGWIWTHVAERIRAAGHRVLAPSLDGCGERKTQIRPGIDTESQAREIVDLMYYEDLHEVVLVGTSSGGMVMARVAEQARDRVARVVFADALALFDGEKIRDIVTRPAAVNTDLALGPTREDAIKRMFVGMEPSIADWAADRLTLHPRLVFEQPVTLDTFWEQAWTATVIYCPQAQNPGEAHQRRCAEKLGARWAEIDTGHYPMLTTPDKLAALIMAQ